MVNVDVAKALPGSHVTLSSWGPTVRPDGTIALKVVEKRLDLAVSTAVARKTPPKDALNLEQLNFDVKNVTVLEPNWLANLDVLVTVSAGGSTMLMKTESVEFPPVTSILYEPAFVRALGVNTNRV
jgi:hypothetical protein